jgi:tetratricopeptide (TPR) repeat protein
MGDRERAQRCYKAGVTAIEKQGWDYAIEMFRTCVKEVPDALNFRQLLRNSTYKKYNDNKSGKGMMGKAGLISIRSQIKKAKAKEQWDEMDQACEEGLLINPWDVQLNVELGDAAMAREFYNIAEFAYSCAVNADPKNKEVLVKLGDALEAATKYDEAGKVWGRIYELDKTDGAARSKMMALQAKKVTVKGGYEGAEGTKDVLSAEEVNRRLKINKQGSGADGPGMDKEADLQRAIRKEPQQHEHYTKLGQFYMKERRYEDAYNIFKQALDVSGNDASVRELLEDSELARLRHNLEIAKERAGESDDPTHRKNAGALAQELLNREIEVMSSREQRYQQNMNLKMELAERFMRRQQWKEAIPRLQQASQDPRLKGKALVKLGSCFMFDNKYPLARGRFELAIPELNATADKDLFMECHYWLARVCEQLQDSAAAEKHYGEVLVLDYNYKDVEKRLEKIQGGGDGAAESA